MATSGRFRDTLIDIENRWSLDHLFDALEVLDLYDEAEEMSRGPERDPR